MTPMTIGNVRLAGPGVPDVVVMGGDQRLVIHELPGGGRMIDVMGAQSSAITWSGTFVGTDAVVRAEALDLLRQSGRSHLLQFESYQIDVVIEHFRYGYAQSGLRLPYEISCQPISPAGPLDAGGILSMISTGLGLARTLLASSNDAGIPSLGTLISTNLLDSASGLTDLERARMTASALADRGNSGLAVLGAHLPMSSETIGASVNAADAMARGVLARSCLGNIALLLQDVSNA